MASVCIFVCKQTKANEMSSSDWSSDVCSSDLQAARPDQRHERLPPDMDLPAPLAIRFAEHGIKLAIPQRIDRRFGGLGHGRGEGARLRMEDKRRPAIADGGDITLHRGPVRSRNGFPAYTRKVELDRKRVR